MHFVPNRLFLTKGVGTHRQELRSFELALRAAGIERCNLVQVSSILPPNCKIIPKKKALQEIVPGQITFCVMARCSSNEPHRLIASSIGIAIPTDSSSYGYLSEHHSYGQTDEAAGDEAEDMAAAMLASTLGLDFDEDKSWDEMKEVYHISDRIVKATNITQSAVITAGYTTTIAAAVYLFDKVE